MFPGLRFETRAPSPRSSTARADVAVFIGFVGVRDTAEDAVRAEYARLGWRDRTLVSLPGIPPKKSGENTLAGASLPPLVVESALAFDALFDGWVYAAKGRQWEGRLSGAVHDFFRQGGRRAWIVPIGLPFVDEDDDGNPIVLTKPKLHTRIDSLVPGAGKASNVTAGDRTTWRGIAHLFGLPEVALVCMPDLPEMVGAPTTPEPPLPELPVGEPAFVECSALPPTPPGVRAVGAPGVPRLGDLEFGRWQVAVAHAVAFVKRHRPDVQLVLAMPLREKGSLAETRPMSDLLQLEESASPPRSNSRLWRHGASRLAPLRVGEVQRDTLLTLASYEGEPPEKLPGIGSAFLQLCWPWYGGGSTVDRPDGLGAPDGLVAGIVARSTLMRGTFRTIAGERVEGVDRLEPELPPAATQRAEPVEEGRDDLALGQRIAMLQKAPARYVLGSDVTTTSNPRWRPANTNRLYGAILRLLREVGETMVFEPSGPEAWAELRARVESVLESFVGAGALEGNPPYSVRCDRRTMSQADLDAGRMVAIVEVAPAPAIERITVILTVSDVSSAELGGMVA